MLDLVLNRKNYPDTFGKDPTKDVTFYMRKDRLKQIAIYHDQISKTEGYYIDDITWNDLEMDDVFYRINNTKSFIGEQVLYHRLHEIDYGGKDLENKVDFFTLNQVQRCETEKKLRNIGKKNTAYYMTRLMSYFEPYSNLETIVFRILQIALVASIIGLIATLSEMFMLLLIAIACTNLAVYMIQKNKAEAMVECLEEICILIETCEAFKKKGIIPAEWMGQDVLSDMNTLRSLKLYAGRFVSKKLVASTGAEALISDYFLGVTLWDMTSYNKIVKMIKKNDAAIMRLFEFVGEIDMAISVASFRKSLNVYCIPVFEKGNYLELQDNQGQTGKKDFGENTLEVKGLVHPLISNPVSNTVSLDHNSFLMGANASGKSTFIKAVAINIILAQTINSCTAESFKLPRMRVMTSMAVRDDVQTGESYYVREVKYLKRMLDAAEDDIPVFCAVDEILKGTNKKERLAASEAVLRYLSGKNSMIMVATHDYELIERLNGEFDCYHFRCILSDDGVEFEYRIRKGAGGETNAVALLNYYDFPKSVVSFANKRLEETGHDNK